MSDRVSSSSEAEAVRMQQLATQRMNLENSSMRQVETEEDFQSWGEQGFEGITTRLFRSMEEMQKTRPRAKNIEKDATEDKLAAVEEKGKVEDAAARFQNRNFELNSRTLMILKSRLSQNDTPESILTKVLEVYSDYALADEALEFLFETTGGALKENVRAAREALNNAYAREIRAGRNIGIQAREFSEKGLGTPTGLRDMYRDITGNPRDPHKLFDELFSEYSYEKMKTVIDFLLHSLGSDLKSKGPSISRPELQLLVEDTRTLQAILGVYRYFQSRMSLIQNQFSNNKLTIPQRMSFELLAKEFMKLLKEKYLSPDKIMQMARTFGLSEEIIAQIIVFTQMRDAIRQVAPKLYRNNMHRQEALMAIIEALEELEEKWAEDDDDHKKNNKKKKEED